MKLATSLFATVLLMFSFGGCSSKAPLGSMEKDLVHNVGLSNTKRGEIVNPSNVKAIVIATYLNQINVDLVKNNEETFLVGVHIVGEFSSDDKEINNPLYRISLNKTGELLNIKKLKSDSIYMKMIPITSKWNDYYLITFASREEKELKLTFENGQYGKVQLIFSKDE